MTSTSLGTRDSKMINNVVQNMYQNMYDSKILNKSGYSIQYFDVL